MPVLATMPAMSGVAAASRILCHLAQQPYNQESVGKRSAVTMTVLRVAADSDWLQGGRCASAAFYASHVWHGCCQSDFVSLG